MENGNTILPLQRAIAGEALHYWRYYASHYFGIFPSYLLYFNWKYRFLVFWNFFYNGCFGRFYDNKFTKKRKFE